MKPTELADVFAPQKFTAECRFRTNSTPNPEKRRVRPRWSNHSLPNREIGHRGPVEIDIAAITVCRDLVVRRRFDEKLTIKPGNRIERVQRKRDWLRGGKIRKTCNVLTNRDPRKERALARKSDVRFITLFSRVRRLALPEERSLRPTHGVGPGRRAKRRAFARGFRQSSRRFRSRV